MTIRARVALIITGIAVFLAAAPAAIFFARGFRYDFQGQRIIRTGTLAIKTDPRAATVLLDGKKLRTAPLVKRFLFPREYRLEIKKDGYQTWRKTVAVHPGQVTLLRPEGEKIYLLAANPESQILATSSPDFFERSPAEQFTIIDDDLYQTGEPPQKINSQVKYAFWDEQARVLLYGNDHEIWLYQPLEKGAANLLVTRSSQTLGLPAYNKKTGYVFVAAGGEIKAIEVSTGGEANIFTLAQTKNQLPPLQVNAEGNQLIYPDADELRRLKIR